MRQHLIRGFAFVATAGALLMLAVAGGCGDNGNGGGGGGVDPQPLAPPAFNLEILSAQLPTGADPVVTFRATDGEGNPIDLIAEMARTAPATPRVGNVRFTIAQLRDNGEYLSLWEATQAGLPFMAGGEQIPAEIPEGANQAVSAQVTPAQAAERLVPQGNGTYQVTLTVPATTRIRTDLDPTKTFTAGMWATRTLESGPVPANDTLNFVPAGGVAQLDQVVNDQACNVCHGLLQAHDSRTGVQLCITCHSPQSTDPQTGNTVDFGVMVHKIHRGSSLPSVEEGEPYRIIGFAPGQFTVYPESAVHDYSHVAFPRPITDCTACHQGEDAGRWQTQASISSCLSCHDNVVFNRSAAVSCDPGVTAACNHGGGPVPINPAGVPAVACTVCHTAASVEQSHVNQDAILASRFRYEVVSTTLDAERRPVVRFRVLDPTNNNAPYDIKTAVPFTQGSASTLNVHVAWPTEEISNVGIPANFGQPMTIAAIANSTAVTEGAPPNTFQVAFQTPVPEGIQSYYVMIDGHPATATGHEIPVTNLVQSFAVPGTGAPPARRTIVSTDKCNACHGILTAHGSNRNNNVLACAVCHNPNATDKRRRPADPATTPDGKDEESIDFKTMVHAIHAVGIKQTPITFYGFGNRAHTFPLGTGNVGNCNVCHEGTSYMLPLSPVVIDTTIDTGENPSDVTDNVRMAAQRAVCQSCHDSTLENAPAGRLPAIPHMEAQAPNSCQNCHGPGAQVDVSQVHPVMIRP